MKPILTKVEEALLEIYDYCDENCANCENCVFDSCIVDKAYKLHTTFISGLANSFGIVEDIPFKIKSIGTKTMTESVEKLAFTLSNGNIYISNGSGDTLNSILDLLMEGTYEVVSNDR